MEKQTGFKRDQNRSRTAHERPPDLFEFRRPHTRFARPRARRYPPETEATRQSRQEADPFPWQPARGRENRERRPFKDQFEAAYGKDDSHRRSAPLVPVILLQALPEFPGLD